MAPKTKSKKSVKVKASAVVDGVSLEDMSKEQLEEHIIHLREELVQEREEKSYMQVERDKIQAIWEISKRSLEAVKEQLRNRSIEGAEAEERHRVEISVYKQKLKQVMSEQHNTTIDAAASASPLRNQHRESELDLRKKIQDMQVELRGKKFKEETCLNDLKLQHQVELMKLSNDYERRLRDTGLKFHLKTRSLMEAKEKKHKKDLEDLEERMSRRMEDLKAEHSQALRLAEQNYSCVQMQLQAEEKQRSKELEEAQRQHKQAHKELSAAQKENKRLAESLKDAELKLPELQTRLEQHNQAEAAKSQARLKRIEEEMKDLRLENRLLQKAFKQVEQERDELLRRQKEDLVDLQQRSSMKELQLQRKLELLTETLDKNRAQLHLALSNIVPTTQTHDML